jgi:hypothetical protein
MKNNTVIFTISSIAIFGISNTYVQRSFSLENQINSFSVQEQEDKSKIDIFNNLIEKSKQTPFDKHAIETQVIG